MADPALPSSSSKVSLPNDASTWSIDQVGQWLDQVGLGQYKETFRANKINNGPTLLEMTEVEYLKAYGIDLRDEPKFLGNIKALKESLPADPSSVLGEKRKREPEVAYAMHTNVPDPLKPSSSSAGPSSPQLEGPPNKWSTEQVHFWMSLEEVGLYDFADKFLRKKVTGTLLLGLTEEKLIKNLQVEDDWDRQRILDTIAALKDSLPAKPSSSSVEVVQSPRRLLEVMNQALEKRREAKRKYGDLAKITDPKLPTQLHHDIANFGEVIGREETFLQYLRELKERIIASQNPMLVASNTKEINGFAAVTLQGSPGMGKSFFEQKLAELINQGKSKSFIESWNDSDWKTEALQLWEDINRIVPFDSMFSVAVTFNQWSYYSTRIESSALSGLIVRVFLRVFFEGQTVPSPPPSFLWQSLAEINVRRSLPEFFDFVREQMASQHKKSYMILIVDELLKAVDPTTVTDFLSPLCRVPPTNFAFLVSSLSAKPLMDFQTSSGRPVHFLPLPPIDITVDQVAKFFPQVTLHGGKFRDVIMYLIVCCGRHPRSLATLREVLDANPGFTSSETSAELCYSSLKSKLLSDVDVLSGAKIMAMLKYALLGEKVALDVPREDLLGLSIRDHAATHASFIALPPDPLAVPVIRSLLLLSYALKGSCDSPTDSRLKSLLRELFSLDVRFDWKCFERFVLIWELLLREIFLFHHRESNLLAWYTRAEHPICSPSTYVSLESVKMDFVAVPHESFFECDCPWSDLKDPIAVLEKCGAILCQPNQPGFDCVFRASSGAYVFAECKFSEIDATTVLNKADVDAKVALFKEQASAMLAMPGIKCFLVFFVWRDVAPAAVKQAVMDSKIHSDINLVILDRSRLQKLFTDTLALRSMFGDLFK